MIRRCFQRQVWHSILLPIKGRLHRKVSTKPDTDSKVGNPVLEMVYVKALAARRGIGMWSIGDKQTVNRAMRVINA